MKNFIAKILIKFITKYNLYAKVGDGKTVFFDLSNTPILFPKDDQWHTTTLSFRLKTGKAAGYIDGVQVKIKPKRHSKTA